MTRILAPIAAIAAVYLLGAFIAWDFNAGNWDQDLRAFIGIIAVVVAGWAIGMTWGARK